jgi:hypothetical protein
MLNDQFKGHPGEDEVKHGYYTILRADSDHYLDEENWERYVSPRANIIMSVLLPGFSHRLEKCPRGCQVALKEVSHSRAAW